MSTQWYFLSVITILFILFSQGEIQARLYEGNNFNIPIEGDLTPYLFHAADSIFVDPNQDFGYIAIEQPSVMVQVNLLTFQETQQMSLPADIKRILNVGFSPDGSEAFIDSLRDDGDSVMMKVFLPSMELVGQTTWRPPNPDNHFGDMRVHDGRLSVIRQNCLTVFNTSSLKQISQTTMPFPPDTTCGFDKMKIHSNILYCQDFVSNPENGPSVLFMIDPLSSSVLRSANVTTLYPTEYVFTRSHTITQETQYVFLSSNYVYIFDADFNTIAFKTLFFPIETIRVVESGNMILFLSGESQLVITLHDSSNGSTSFHEHFHHYSLPFEEGIHTHLHLLSSFSPCIDGRCILSFRYGLAYDSALISTVELTSEGNITFPANKYSQYRLDSMESIGAIGHLFLEDPHDYRDRIDTDGRIFIGVSRTYTMSIIRADIDRGLLLNRVTVPSNSESCTGYTYSGVAYDPDHRLLYVACLQKIYQFDIDSFTMSPDPVFIPDMVRLNAVHNGGDGYIYILQKDCLTRFRSSRDSFPPSENDLESIRLDTDLGMGESNSLVTRRVSMGTDRTTPTHIFLSRAAIAFLIDIRSSSMEVNVTVVFDHSTTVSSAVYDAVNDHFLIIQDTLDTNSEEFLVLQALDGETLNTVYTSQLFPRGLPYFNMYIDRHRLYITPGIDPASGSEEDDALFTLLERNVNATFNGVQPMVVSSSSMVPAADIVPLPKDDQLAVSTAHGKDTILLLEMEDADRSCYGIAAMDAQVCSGNGVCEPQGCQCASQYYGRECEYSCEFNQVYSSELEKCVDLEFSLMSPNQEYITSCESIVIDTQHNLPSSLLANISWHLSVDTKPLQIVSEQNAAEVDSFYSEFYDPNTIALNQYLHEHASTLSQRMLSTSNHSFSIPGDRFLAGLCYYIQLRGTFSGVVDDVSTYKHVGFCFPPIDVFQTSLSIPSRSPSSPPPPTNHVNWRRTDPYHVQAYMNYRSCSIREEKLYDAIGMDALYQFEWYTNMTNPIEYGTLLTVGGNELMPRESYALELTARHKTKPELSLSQSSEIRVLQQDLVAVIEGGDREVNPEISPIYLDASHSYDPDRMNFNETFHWSCVLGSNCREAVEFREENESGSIVSIAKGVLNANEYYKFQVEYSTADGRSSTAKEVIYTTHQGPHIPIEIYSDAILSEYPVIDIHQPIALTTRIGRRNLDNDISPLQLRYRWQVLQGDISFNAMKNTSFRTSDSAANMVIARDALSYGTKYTIRVLVSEAEEDTSLGFSEIGFTPVSPLLYAGELRPHVEPLHGIPFKTQFTIRIPTDQMEADRMTLDHDSPAWGRIRFNYGYLSPTMDGNRHDVFVSVSGGYVYDTEWSLTLPVAEENITLQVYAQDVQTGIIAPLTMSKDMMVSLSEYRWRMNNHITDQMELVENSLNETLNRSDFRDSYVHLWSMVSTAMNYEPHTEDSNDFEWRHNLWRTSIQSILPLHDRFASHLIVGSQEHRDFISGLASMIAVATRSPHCKLTPSRHQQQQDLSQSMDILLDLFEQHSNTEAFPFAFSASQILYNSYITSSSNSSSCPSNIKEKNSTNNVYEWYFTMTGKTISVFDRFARIYSHKLIEEALGSVFHFSHGSGMALRRFSYRQMNSDCCQLSLELSVKGYDEEANTHTMILPQHLIHDLEKKYELNKSSIIVSLTRFPILPYDLISEESSTLSSSKENKNGSVIIDHENSIRIGFMNGKDSKPIQLEHNNALSEPINFTMPLTISSEQFHQIGSVNNSEDDNNDNDNDNMITEYVPICVHFDQSKRVWSSNGCTATMTNKSLIQQEINDDLHFREFSSQTLLSKQKSSSLVLCSCSRWDSVFSVGLKRVVRPKPNTGGLSTREIIMWVGISVGIAVGLLLGVISFVFRRRIPGIRKKKQDDEEHVEFPGQQATAITLSDN